MKAAKGAGRLMEQQRGFESIRAADGDAQQLQLCWLQKGLIKKSSFNYEVPITTLKVIRLHAV